MTHVFGLTGGIGSGKSSVGRHFAGRGLPVVDADVLAREVVAPGSAALAELIAEFGEGILTASGELDRKTLAARVFENEAARKRLNSITHPRVRDLSVQRFQSLGAAGEPLVCYEVPLLFESGLADAIRPVVVVSVPHEVQIARSMARDAATQQEIEARIESQLPLAEKERRADHVIDNSGELSATLFRADQVLRAICASLGVDPARYSL